MRGEWSFQPHAFGSLNMWHVGEDPFFVVDHCWMRDQVIKLHWVPFLRLVRFQVPVWQRLFLILCVPHIVLALPLGDPLIRSLPRVYVHICIQLHTCIKHHRTSIFRGLCFCAPPCMSCRRASFISKTTNCISPVACCHHFLPWQTIITQRDRHESD